MPSRKTGKALPTKTLKQNLLAATTAVVSRHETASGWSGSDLPGAAFRENAGDEGVVEAAALGEVENVVAPAHQLHFGEHVADVGAGDADVPGLIRCAGYLKHLLHLRKTPYLAGEALLKRSPVVAHDGKFATHRPGIPIFLGNLVVAEPGGRKVLEYLQRTRLLFGKRGPGGDAGIYIYIRQVIFQEFIEYRTHGQGADRNLESVRDELALEAVVGHVEDVGEEMVAA